MDKRIRLGDRTFLHMGESTVGHDYHFMALARQAGMEGSAPREGEDVDSFLARIVVTVTGSGVAMDLLGDLIIPEDRVQDKARPGESWTPEIAAETASFIAGLSSEKDKEEIRKLWAPVLFPFCGNGMSSLVNSMIASALQAPTAPATTDPAATGAGTAS